MANVTFSYTPQPPPACYPSDANGMLSLIAGGALQGTIPDTAGGGIVVQPTPPPTSLANKVWLKTDAAGRPLGWYSFYQGVWRKIYTGVTIGEIRMFYTNTGEFDGTGLGTIGGNMDGWALCNGNNGTPNLEAMWPVCGQVSGTAFVTDTDGVGFKQFGGVKGLTTIRAANLPPLHTQISAHPATVQAGSGHTDTFLSGAGTDTTLTGYPVTETINSPNSALPYPLYVALGFFQFVGY